MNQLLLPRIRISEIWSHVADKAGASAAAGTWLDFRMNPVVVCEHLA